MFLLQNAAISKQPATRLTDQDYRELQRRAGRLVYVLSSVGFACESAKQPDTTPGKSTRQNKATEWTAVGRQGYRKIGDLHANILPWVRYSVRGRRGNRWGARIGSALGLEDLRREFATPDRYREATWRA